MSSFGELVLVVGDYHIGRESDIPQQFKKMLNPGKMQHVVCTGNIGSKQHYDDLRQLAPNIHIVAGDCEFDRSNSPGEAVFPATRTLQVGDFKIGVIHGHQIVPWGDHHAISAVRRKLDADILIFGHTHRCEITQHDGHFHINPGSITGSFSPMQDDVIPSFILLAVQGSNVVCYVYELINGELEVSKTEFSKDDNQVEQS